MLLLLSLFFFKLVLCFLLVLAFLLGLGLISFFIFFPNIVDLGLIFVDSESLLLFFGSKYPYLIISSKTKPEIDFVPFLRKVIKNIIYIY